MRGAVAQATRQDPCHRTQRTSRQVVTAVVVAHDGARLLPGLVQGVREQTHPVQRVVGVDTGSQDRSGATLTELLGQDAVFGMEPETGYGAAVARALQHPTARRPPPAQIPGSPRSGHRVDLAAARRLRAWPPTPLSSCSTRPAAAGRWRSSARS